MNEHVASVIKVIRKSTGLTQAALAEEIGFTPGHVGSLEQGRAIPSYKLMKILVNMYDIDANMFFGKAQETTKVIKVKDANTIYNALDVVREMLRDYQLPDTETPEEE